MCVVIDTRHNQFADAIICGFASPLHEGPAFGIVYPKYFVSLDDPYIYNFLQAYIQPQGFDMSVNSLILQLKTLTIFLFGNVSLPPLQAHVRNTSQLLSEVESRTSSTTTPITFEWNGITYPTEWESQYEKYYAKSQQQEFQKIAKVKPVAFSHITQSFNMNPKIVNSVKKVPREVTELPLASST